MAKSSNDKQSTKRGSKLSMGAATDKLAELAQNPLARSMLAAGLVAAAAALTSNEKIREGAKKAGREALEGAEAAADNASKIGAAIVTAATDAVRRMMASGDGDDSGSTARSTSGGRGKAGRGKAASAGTRSRRSAASKSAGAASSGGSATGAARRGRPPAAGGKPKASGRGAKAATAASQPSRARGASKRGSTARRGRKSSPQPAGDGSPG